MKVLSVKQPWAWLIVEGIKPVENRSWNTAHRGPLLIHACQEWDDLGGFADREADVLMGLSNSSELPLNDDTWPTEDNSPAVDMSEFRTGGIVGRVHVKDVVSPQEKRAKKETLGPFYNPRYYGWIMTKAERIPFTPAKGQQKLWEHEEPMEDGRTSEQEALF